jgi:hypothetical protein
VFGCRRAGVSAIHLDPGVDPEWAERLAPSVLVGDPQQLVAILARARESGHQLANLRTVIAVGDPLSSELRSRLHTLSEAVVVAAWAPPGVRAVWSECRAAAARSVPTGYHAWDEDFLEVAPLPDSEPGSGELLWTGLGWRGSAVLRLRTYTTVAIDRTQCAACGSASVRILPMHPVPRPVVADAVIDTTPAAVTAEVVEPVATEAPSAIPQSDEAVLDNEVDVAAWQIEYREVDGRREIIVTLAPAWAAAVVPLIRRLDRQLSATQFVVLTADEVARRIDASGGRRVLGGR